MDPESSVELIRLAQSGDDDALSRLLERHLPELRRWAHGRLPQFARDLADTLLALVADGHQTHPGCPA